jgi:bifunctional non-homologous end joining protein LigD
VRLITKGGYNWTDRYPWIVEAALKNRHNQFVIDSHANRPDGIGGEPEATSG